MLRASASQGPGEAVAIVPSKKPFSFAAGLARREIWVSSALVEALTPEELDGVLLHERAHLERHDPLRRAAAETFSLPLWPSTRRAILAELALATEQCCDEIAAERLAMPRTRTRPSEPAPSPSTATTGARSAPVQWTRQR